MKNKKRLTALLMAVVLSLALVPCVSAEEELDDRIYCAVVRFEDGVDVQESCTRLEALPGVRVRWEYQHIFSGAAIEGTRAALALVEQQNTIASLSMSRTWAQFDVVTDPLVSSNSLDTMDALSLEYDGDGTVIAVIDSGIRLSHEVFNNYGILDTPVLQEEDIRNFIDNGGTDGRYVSQKIPFAFDYNGQDRSVHTTDNHGTHVSALAVGYAEREDGTIKFQGVAPAAQLLAMKVFSDDARQGAADVDILKAMEDAYVLGADVINLSLGTESGFTEGEKIGSLYSEAIQTMRDAGVIVCCAAGNSAAAVSMPSGGYTDYGTICVPAACPGATAVAAVNSAFYEGGGGLMIGDQVFDYDKTVSENDEQTPPDIDLLAGQKLPYVVIDGLGKAEDFVGLDLTGCVAVIRRGEIYFSEKTQNAAQAGAVACLIYNNEPGMIRAAVENTTIPSAIIAQEVGYYLIEQAENGRGVLTFAPNRITISTEKEMTMLEASSWGAANDLRLVPSLTAPGGTVLSADVGGSAQYTYLSGTSMASPNAAGAFATMMQALDERFSLERRARADLAEALLESTAALMTDENGTPLSPRQQGAGVIQFSAALESPAVILNPLLELGDSITGQFELSFQVKNLTQEKLVFSVDTTVLTDQIHLEKEKIYSALLPMDITEAVSVSGGKTVVVKPESEQIVRLSIQVSRQLRKELADLCPNGFFTEGYITLTEVSGSQIHAAFLGYCGDWGASPILEQTDFRDVMSALAQSSEASEDLPVGLPVDMAYNLAYLYGDSFDAEEALLLGENPWQMTMPNDRRIAMSVRDSDALTTGGYQFVIDLYTLRDAAHIIMMVSDQQTGEIYRVYDAEYLPRAKISDLSGMAESSMRVFWDGTDNSGELLKSGTKVNVEFYAWLNQDSLIQDVYARNVREKQDPMSYRWLCSGSYDKYLEWEFPLMLDGESPTVSVNWNQRTQKLELTVKDREYASYVKVQDGTGNTLLQEVLDSQKRGETYRFALELPETAAQSEKLYITVADYATNIMGYCLDFSALQRGEKVDLKRCPMALLEDVQKDAWYHEAVDYVYENGWMSGRSMLTFSPNQNATRADTIATLYQIAGKPEVGEVELPPTDVKPGSFYENALKWAYREGIITGFEENMFAVFAAVSRQQLAVLLYRYALLSGEAVSFQEEILQNYTDADTTADWAYEAMVWAVNRGYLSGDISGAIRPDAYATRAELAQVLMNFCKDNKL
ncbi:MAG: S8 family serine peptidase [Oscillospiraceae bacterium]|nr:S8 family serine peptidase [Oscillospiraceae bacterium]